MNSLLPELVTQIDLLESKQPQSFPWKESLNAIVHTIESVEASADSEQVNTANPLFAYLAKQNEILMALVLLVLIVGKSK